ncbi:MAG TPA: HD domain-containing protein [Polyangiaceae bacterium]|nr:HD domain-containing protein [Polyangiaceae bacterium]
MDLSRLEQQLNFVKEIDQLKRVQRKSFVSGSRRLENSAEHSWHVAMMAWVLSEHAAPPGVDVDRVLKMLLVHDLVEIDAGDTLLYAEAEMQRAQREREVAAAERLFSLLPDGQGSQLRALWEEFEARESPDAKFAAAVDRLQPLILNFMSEGAAWRRHGVTAPEVIEKNRHIAEGSPGLWAAAEQLIEEAIRRGYLRHEI